MKSEFVAAAVVMTALGAAASCSAVLDFDALEGGPASGATSAASSGAVGGSGGVAATGTGGTPVSSGAGAGGGGGLDRGLLFHYLMEQSEGTLVTDVSGAGHDGNVSGRPTWSDGICGRYGLALNPLDGGVDPNADFVEVSALPPITGALTVSAWLWIDTDPAPVDTHVVSKTGGGDTGRGWALRIAPLVPGDAFYSVWFEVSGDGTQASVVIAKTAEPLPFASWLHVAVVFRPGVDLEIWVDGVQKKYLSSPGLAAAYDTVDRVHIGNRPTDPCCRFHGKVDNVRVYERALSAAELGMLATECP